MHSFAAYVPLTFQNDLRREILIYTTALYFMLLAHLKTFFYSIKRNCRNIKLC